MAARSDVIPADFLAHLQQTISGFENRSIKHQCALAKMVWIGGTKHRQHRYHEGAMWFGYEELEKAFGRNGFKVINQQLALFEVTPNWASNHETKNAATHTKGFWFTEKVFKSRQDYLKHVRKNSTQLLMLDGKKLKTLPKAVAAKDTRGLTTTAWGAATALNRVKVNLESLGELHFWLHSLRDSWQKGQAPSDSKAQYATLEIRDSWQKGQAPSDSKAQYATLEIVERLVNTTSQVIRLANTDLAGQGYCPHRYVEATSGRLYAEGINLQTAPTLIKQAALMGLWEYDFSNCHFAIMEQMGKRHGHPCEAITQYLAAKKLTRQTIAREAGITEVQAKTCLLAIMYGARASEWHENAIPAEIGVEAARRLYRVPSFKAIASGIAQTRKAVLQSCKRTANGSLTNLFGKAISGKSKEVEQIAHLLQGVEAKALQAAMNLYPQDIVLLQHDGFVASRALDKQAIMQAVFQVTGYSFELEEKVIELDPHAQFMKSMKRQNPN